MKKLITYKGEWFVPENDQKKVTGILSFSANDRSELELMGRLTEKKDAYGDEPITIILGFTTDGKLITLFRSYYVSSSITSSIHSPGVETIKYTTILVLVGDHFYNEEELVFHKVGAGFKNFEQWASKSGFNGLEHEKESRKYSLNCELPQVINFDIGNGSVGKMSFSLRTNSSVYNIDLKQNARIDIESANPKPLTDLLDDLILFQKFLTLGTFEPTAAYEIIVRNNDRKDTFLNRDLIRDINILYEQELDAPLIKDKMRAQLLFNYQDIENNFETIIQKWYAVSNRLEPITSLLIDNFYSRLFAFNENKFLNIVQALETFHRRFRKNEVLPKGEHKKKVQAIVGSVEEEYKNWLQERLNFSNEPTLYDRLSDLFDETSCGTINNLIKDKEKFLKDTRNNRNYYTHYDEKIKKKALEINDLFLLTEKLKVILIAIVLIEIGISKDQISQLLERNEFNFFNHILRNDAVKID
ncbi:MAG TPA: HEPN domain-containing protein [Arachidicoccus sp.]|nr:HEPN domain-containing protein [Arachidicoccus sp.]